MVSKFKNYLRLILIKSGIWLSKTTETNKIRDFFLMVAPVNTSYSLIRLGGNGDGGYLVPDDLEDIKVCFSPGVCATADFENDLTRMGIKCFLADYAVESAPIDNPLFNFEKKYLGPINSDIFMTLESWVNLKSPEGSNFILQMDIEGAEYSVILDAPTKILEKFKVLVIEFHGLETLLSKEGFKLIELTFIKILKTFEVVHIHPNNCCEPVECDGVLIPPVMEFTFLRRDRVINKGACKNFPHSLDRVNDVLKHDFPLPSCWYDAPVR